MQRTVTIGLVLIGLTAASAPKAPATTAPTAQKQAAKSTAPVTVADAPADEYFGPFKYSALSTRTKIDALGRAYRERWTDDASLVHDAGLVQSSLEAWAQKYPKDRWLAPTAFHLAQLYMEIQSPDARSHARTMFDYVAKTYPATPQGHLARARLAQGFPPLHDEPPVSPTPSPYGPSPAPSAQPAASGAPEAPAAPSPAASAAPAKAAPQSSAAPKAAPQSSTPPAPAPVASAKPG
ncbi:MAG TPA: hypothetical protein VHT53_10610 [Candidatus Elarobacter sp.]|jgi:hypothetical protein|nr:hypothetical protein [Candidatus Elarobacter sp.]